MTALELSPYERKLAQAMRAQGYALIPQGDGFYLKPLPCAGYVFCELPYMFRSVQAAADHLCSVVHDSEFTALVNECL